MTLKLLFLDPVPDTVQAFWDKTMPQMQRNVEAAIAGWRQLNPIALPQFLPPYLYAERTSKEARMCVIDRAYFFASSDVHKRVRQIVNNRTKDFPPGTKFVLVFNDILKRVVRIACAVEEPT